MKSQMILFQFHQLKTYLAIIVGFSLPFMTFVVGNDPKLEVIGLIGLFTMVSLTLGLQQIHADDTFNETNLYLLHLPIEKSHLWMSRSIVGISILCFYYALLNLLTVFNPSTPLIDLMILLFGLSSYYLARIISVFGSDIVKGIFITMFCVSLLSWIFSPIVVIANLNGLGFPIKINGIYILAYFMFTITASFYFEIKHFRKTIN